MYELHHTCSVRNFRRTIPVPIAVDPTEGAETAPLKFRRLIRLLCAAKSLRRINRVTTAVYQ